MFLCVGAAAASATPRANLAWESTAEHSSEQDISCPAFDGMPQEPGCQVRCTDFNCSTAERAVSNLRTSTVPSAHMAYNRCPPFTHSWATIKSGADETAGMPGNTLCERICAVQLSSVAVKRRMAHHRALCEGARGSVVLSDGHVHATNVVVDIRRSVCSGPSRTFHPGFLRLPCSIEGKVDTGSDTRQSAILESAVVDGRLQSLRVPARTETGLVIFVTRTDMGNMAHNLGTVVGVFNIVHALTRSAALKSPLRITSATLAVRPVCSAGMSMTRTRPFPTVSQVRDARRAAHVLACHATIGREGALPAGLLRPVPRVLECDRRHGRREPRARAARVGERRRRARGRGDFCYQGRAVARARLGRRKLMHRSFHS